MEGVETNSRSFKKLTLNIDKSNIFLSPIFSELIEVESVLVVTVRKKRDSKRSSEP